MGQVDVYKAHSGINFSWYFARVVTTMHLHEDDVNFARQSHKLTEFLSSELLRMFSMLPYSEITEYITEISPTEWEMHIVLLTLDP